MNKVNIKERLHRWYLNNKGKHRCARELWYEANKKEMLEYSRRWRKENPEKVVLHIGRRRFYLKERMPKWANQEKIKEIYLQRDRLTETTGVPYEVDHIIPLNGKNVCGLHVENNLQILPAKENNRKRNKFLV